MTAVCVCPHKTIFQYLCCKSKYPEAEWAVSGCESARCLRSDGVTMADFCLVHQDYCSQFQKNRLEKGAPCRRHTWRHGSRTSYGHMERDKKTDRGHWRWKGEEMCSPMVQRKYDVWRTWPRPSTQKGATNDKVTWFASWRRTPKITPKCMHVALVPSYPLI